MQATDEGGKYEMMHTKPGGSTKMNAIYKSKRPTLTSQSNDNL